MANEVANVLIVPLPEYGHILPTLGLTKSLSSQGHRVTYVAPPQFRDVISSVGGYLEWMTADEFNPTEISGGSVWYRFIHDYGRDTKALRFRLWLQLIIGDGDFAIVLCDHILGKNYREAVFSRIKHRCCVMFSTSLFNWNEYKADQSKIPTIVFCPQAFEVSKFRTQHPGLFHVGPSLPPEELESGLGDIQVGGAPLVLVSFGTQSIRYRGMDELLRTITMLAVNKKDFQFVVATGSVSRLRYNNQGYELPNLTIRTRLPQRLLLKKASAMITHGGLGGIKESICESVPLIVLPMLHDQPYNAMRIRYNGLGEAIFPQHRSLRAIENAVCRAVEGDYAHGLAIMKAKFLALEEAKLPELFILNRLSDRENASTLHSYDGHLFAKRLPNV